MGGRRQADSAPKQPRAKHTRADAEGLRRCYKFLLRPTSKQAAELNRQLALHCEVYNAALQERRDAWKMRRISVLYRDQSAQLKLIRQERADIGELQFHPVLETVRRVDKAFAAFFRRVKAGEKAGYPRFRSAARFDSMTYPYAENARYCEATRRIKLHKVGTVRVHQHRAIPADATIKTVTIKREGRKWYVIFSCADIAQRDLDRTGAVTGIDLGVASFLTTSEGRHLPNPRHGHAAQRKLAESQRALARSKKGSERGRRRRARIAKTQRKIRNQRRDHSHKVALDLVQRHDVIVHERLSISSMTRSAKGSVAEPGKKVAAKAGLNRAIRDASWGDFFKILRDKAEWAGREVIAVEARNTSRTCSACGYVAKENRMTQAAFHCQMCDHEGHADVNAAINIMRAGLALREVAA